MDRQLGCSGADRSFGPAVPSSCRGGFDFTLLFEQIFLSSLPAAALLLAASARLWQLRRAPAVASGAAVLQLGKQCAAWSQAITQLVTLVLLSIPSAFRTNLSVASAVLTLVASLLICPLSYWEGTRSPRPSPLLNVYLLVSSLFEVVQLRTLWLAGSYDASLRRVAISSSVGLGLKMALLVLEAVPKATLTPEQQQHLSREQTSGVYSLRTFWWLNRILWLGRCKRLQPSDLYLIDPGLKTARYSSPLATAWDKVDHNKKYALLLAVFSTLKWPLLMPALPRIILIGFNFAQPLLIKRALSFVAQDDGDENIGYGLIGATILVYSGLAIFNGYYGHLLYRSVTIVRGSLVDIIYRKSLNIELSVAQKAAPAGLVTADVERIDFTIEKLHSLWASVIELGIGIFLLQREVGWACIAPAVVAIICTLCTSYISKLLPSRQKKWNQAVQDRVALTSKMLSSMKTVKMMGFSNYIETTLQAARMAELATSAGFRRCMSVVNTLVLVPRQISAPFTLTLFVLAVHGGSTTGVLTASRAFTTLSIIEIITTPLSLLLQTLPSITSSLACLDRIQTYLKSPDRIDQRAREPQDVLCSDGESMEKKEALVESVRQYPGPVISIREASIAYYSTSTDSPPPAPVLDSISLTVPHGSITMLVGPVGSGKSSLLKAVLGELVLQQGDIYVRPGPIAYCDQNPWLPNGSVRDCIVGTTQDAEFDSSWYQEVVHTCALEQDIASLTNGSDTNVGSRGIALSDGQKHRLALARAIYSRSPLLILDNVLRSLDVHTEVRIGERLLSPTGLLKRYSMTAIFVTHSARHLPLADQIVVLDKGGKSLQVGDFQKLKACEGYIQSLAVQQSSPDPAATVLLGSQPGSGPGGAEEGQAGSQRKEPPPAKKIVGQGTPLLGTRDKATYRFYFKPIGIWRCAVLLFAVMSLAFLTRFQRIWVEWWVKAHDHQSMYIGVYFLLAVGACMSFTFFFWWMFMFVVPVTAGGLHEQLLRSILHAPLSYFTSIDSGVILNRFSQDMAILNGQLPVTFFQAASVAMMGLTQIALIAYGSKYMATAVPVTLVALGLLARFYLLTSQQLRILDLELKAPIYTSLTETQEGLATIRAFGWRASFERRCRARIDDSKRAIYLLFMVQRWLNFVLDLVVAGMATVLMALATQLRSSTDAAALGVGLSSVIGFSLLVSQFIVTYTDLENSLGAIARIKDCVDTIKSEEAPPGLREPPPDWPAKGEVSVSSVTAYYDDEEKPALSDVSFRAAAGHKVFICGRTGSGKSTLLSLLLRLSDAQAGQVCIDGIDIATISPDVVRRSIAVIPQSPFFLPGSVRLNLGASGVESDGAMVAALEKVGLWDLVASRGGLQAAMSAVALSHGQQQLFCLATAMLRKCKIVVMDEATSGVDEETETKMYDLMQEEFRDGTVISVAHRLKMAEGCDLVVVLSGGKCVEIGEPSALLEQRGEFWQLTQA